MGRSPVLKRNWRWGLAALLLLVAAWLIQRWREATRESLYDRAILAAATRYDVHPALIKAVVWRESGFNPGAEGKAGEIGLMQVREPAAREWADAENISSFAHWQIQDPQKNVLAGAWYLKKMLKRYARADNPLPYALADYNAGRSNVLRWSRGEAATNSVMFVQQITFPGTREYILSVSRRFNHYTKTFRDGESGRGLPLSKT